MPFALHTLFCLHMYNTRFCYYQSTHTWLIKLKIYVRFVISDTMFLGFIWPCSNLLCRGVYIAFLSKLLLSINPLNWSLKFRVISETWEFWISWAILTLLYLEWRIFVISSWWNPICLDRRGIIYSPVTYLCLITAILSAAIFCFKNSIESLRGVPIKPGVASHMGSTLGRIRRPA